MPFANLFALSLLVCLVNIMGFPAHAEQAAREYLQARWNPLHFKPAIDEATDEQCLECHQEVIGNKPLKASPAGVKAAESLAWYQTLTDYQGDQDTFHRRHLTSDAAKRLMNFRCNTCHQGSNPNSEVEAFKGQPHGNPELRKQVDSDICLMCHGKFDYKVMAGLSGDWPEIRDIFKNDCVTCHLEFRTKRHQLNFLNAEGIEEAGKENSDSCYGCHGGRAWYAIPYPYVRTAWLERMPGIPPEWAHDRPTEYPYRFLSAETKKKLKKQPKEPEQPAGPEEPKGPDEFDVPIAPEKPDVVSNDYTKDKEDIGDDL